MHHFVNEGGEDLSILPKSKPVRIQSDFGGAFPYTRIAALLELVMPIMPVGVRIPLERVDLVEKLSAGEAAKLTGPDNWGNSTELGPYALARFTLHD